VVYHCLAGETPFKRESDVAVIHAHLNDQPRPLSALRPDLPPAVDRVLATAMAKDPDARYQTGGRFADDLRSALSGSGTRVDVTAPAVPPAKHTLPHPGATMGTLPPPRTGAGRSAVRSRRVLVGAAVFLLAGGGAAAAVVVARGSGGKSTGGPRTQSIMPGLRSHLRTIATDHSVLNQRLRALSSTSTSLAAVSDAGQTVQHDVLIAKGYTSRLSPHSQAERATLNAVERALSDDAGYANALASLPSTTSSLSKSAANRVVDGAEAAENSYTVLAGTAPSLPAVPVSHTDDTVLLSLVPKPVVNPQPQPPTTTTQIPTGVQQLTTFTGSIFTISYPQGWVVDTSEQQKPGYVDTTIRDPSDPQHTYLRADYTPNVHTSLYDAANQQRQNHPPGYVELAFDRTTLDGLPAIKWEFEGYYQKPGDAGPVFVHKIDIFMIDAQHTGWAILTQAPATTYFNWLPTFHAMFDSFTVTH
jgi:hypothetical protein